MKKKEYKDMEHENACLKEQMAYKDRLIEVGSPFHCYSVNDFFSNNLKLLNYNS